MATCEVCGNDYDKAFEVRLADGGSHFFDSFECAIHALAPTCDNCGVKIVGHGEESNGSFFCCAHCAEEAGVSGMRDRTDSSGTAPEGEGDISPTRPPQDS